MLAEYDAAGPGERRGAAPPRLVLSHLVEWQRQRAQPHALTAAERAEVLAVLASDRFVDAAPAQVWATLLDEGTCLASQSTKYRLLRSVGQSRERRRQARHPAHVKPELVATGPNQVWSWDTTALRGPATWTSYYLYVVLDVFSRKAVGWLLAARESAALAERLLAQTMTRERVDRDQLTIHADRGTSMASKPVGLLLADLGVTKSHSRLRVSKDNPTARRSSRPSSTAPTFPAGSAASSTPATPACRHVHAQRAEVLAAAHARYPDRLRHGQPRPPALPGPTWINEPERTATARLSATGPAADPRGTDSIHEDGHGARDPVGERKYDTIGGASAAPTTTLAAAPAASPSHLATPVGGVHRRKMYPVVGMVHAARKPEPVWDSA